MYKKKYIIFGPGSMAEKHYLEFSKKNIDLVAIYSPKIITNNMFSKITHINNITDLDDVDFDFGVITSPNMFHYEQIEYLLKQNKPVFVEKPIVVNLKQIENIKRNFDISNIFVSFNLRFLEQTNSLLQTDFEKYQQIDIKWCKNLLPNNSWSLDKNISGGGILIDWGVHAIDLLHFIYNEKLIFQSINFQNKGDSIDLSFDLKLKCAERIINIQMSWLEKTSKSPLTIYFSNDQSHIIWKKNDPNLICNNKPLISDNKKCIDMYDYFINTYLDNYDDTQSVRQRNSKNYIESIALIDKCYQNL